MSRSPQYGARPPERSRLTLRLPGIYGSRVPLLVLPIAGGLGLVVHILTRVSLSLAFAVLAAAGVLAWSLLLPRADPSTRTQLLQRVRVGLLAGLVGTLLYDAARYGIVALLSFSIEPFHVWLLFGRAIIGFAPPEAAAFAVGTAFHLVNGIGFGVAFTLLVRRPTWWRGVLWGLGLELAMALLYPGWLRLTQLQEFMTMSVLGHIVYGGTLGAVAAIALRGYARKPDAAGSSSAVRGGS